MSNNSAVHQQVAEAYTRAVSQKSDDGCCSSLSEGCGSSNTEAVSPKGVAAQSANYSSDELASLPAVAVANSF